VSAKILNLRIDYTMSNYRKGGRIDKLGKVPPPGASEVSRRLRFLIAVTMVRPSESTVTCAILRNTSPIPPRHNE